jgi:hypothetical protein
MASPASTVLAPQRPQPVPDGAPRGAAWHTDVLLLVMSLIWGVNFSVVKYGRG